MFPLGAAYKIITVLICNVTTSCFLLTLGGLGAASRLPSGLKSHPSCSRFPGKRRDFQVRKLDVPGRGKGERFQLQRFSPGYPQEREEWTAGTFVCARLPGTAAEWPGWDAGPTVRAGPGTVQGKRARAARPGSQRSAAARLPPPTGAEPGPSWGRAGSLLFLAST